MSQDLQIALSSVIAAIVGWFVRQFIGNKPMPLNATNPAPARPVNPAKLDSTSEHPLLSFLVTAIVRWLGLSSEMLLTRGSNVDNSDDEAALQVVASAVRSDPKRLERLKSLLG